MCMTESPAWIRKHIKFLSLFEMRYGEFLAARRKREINGQSDWSLREWAERERELRMLAPRADAAMEASGQGAWDDLPGLILSFDDWTGFSSDARDDKLQREILAQIPSQTAGLEMRLEEAEATARRWIRLPRLPSLRSSWLNHPWVVGIGVTVIGGGILVVIGALLD